MIQELQTERLDINNKYDIDFSCKQLDDIILKIIVYDKSLPADLSNYNCRLKAFKSDQVPLIQNTNITIKDNFVTIKASKQLTTTQGIVKAELQFINKTTLEKKSTFYINIEVVASVLDVDGIVSTPTCTILEEIDHKLDEIENIGEVLDQAKEVRDTLQNTTIPTGININSKLETNTKNASTKITEVENIITNASNKIEEVETSINNANTCKKGLDLSKTNADISKENLDTANVQAEKNIEALNSLGNVTDLAKNVQTNTTDIGTLKENVENNTSQLKDCVKDIKALNDDRGYLVTKSLSDKCDILDLNLCNGKYNGYDALNSPFSGEKYELEVIGSTRFYIQKTNYSGYGVNSYINIYNSQTSAWNGWQQLATTEIDLLTYLNGWHGVAGNQEVVKCGNMVNIDVVLNNGSMTANSSIIQLPNGFRPNATLYFTAKAHDSNYNLQNIGVLIYTDGRVVFDGTPSGNTRLILNHTFYSK